MISCKEVQSLTEYAQTTTKAKAIRLYKSYFADNIEKQIIEAAKKGENDVTININMHLVDSSEATNVNADHILDCLINDCPGFKITRLGSGCVVGLDGQPFQRTAEISWKVR